MNKSTKDIFYSASRFTPIVNCVPGAELIKKLSDYKVIAHEEVSYTRYKKYLFDWE